MSDLYPAEDLEARVNRVYPGVWRNLDEARAAMGKNEWPLEIILPMHLLEDMEAEICGTENNSFEQNSGLGEIEAESGREKACFDPNVCGTAPAAGMSGNFPVDALQQLPARGAHIESPGLKLMDAMRDGFMGRLDVSSDGAKKPRVFFPATDGDIEFVPPLGEGTIAEAFKEIFIKTEALFADYGAGIPEMAEPGALAGLSRAANPVLHACPRGLNDMAWQIERNAASPAAGKINGGCRIFSRNKNNKQGIHVIGGAADRQISPVSAREKRGGNHAGPGPRLRGARRHGFSSGSRRNESRLYLNIRRVSPIPAFPKDETEFSA